MFHSENWSEQSACATRVVFYTGWWTNIVANKIIPKKRGRPLACATIDITHHTWEGDSLLYNGAQCLIIPPPATVTNTPLAHLRSRIFLPVSLSGK